MKAIILAAGQGTRLKKYTENLPKGMLMFDGKTIIERQIEAYKKQGINDIIIIKGFAADKIQYDDVTYYTNTEFDKTNMVESLLAAKTEFDDDIIVSYSDVLFNEEMLKGMINSVGDFVVSVDMEWKSYWKERYGKVDFDTESLALDDNMNIVSIGLPDPSIEEIDARYVGILKFSNKGLKEILRVMDRDYLEYADKPWQQSGKTIRQAYMTDLLQAMIEEGHSVKAEPFENGWVEFDTNEDYERACEWVNNGILDKIFYKR